MSGGSDLYPGVRERYFWIVDFSSKLVEILGVERSAGFDLAQCLEYKLGGYNGNLDRLLLSVQKETRKAKVFLRFAMAGRFFLALRERGRATREITLDATLLADVRPSKRRYDQVFYVHYRTYLKALLPYLESSRKGLLLLPSGARQWAEWGTLEKIVAENSHELYFFEAMLGKDFFEQVERCSSRLLKTAQKKHSEIAGLMTFGGHGFSKQYGPVLLRFIKHFIPFHLLFARRLEAFLLPVLDERTVFITGRIRSALSCVSAQIARHKGAKVVMVNHGVMQLDLENMLFPNGRFDLVSQAHVWGPYDVEVIRRIQKLKGKPMPEIRFFAPFATCAIDAQVPGKKIVVGIDESIKQIVPRLPYIFSETDEVVVRFHPAERYLAKQLRRYEGRLIFDRADKPIQETFRGAAVYVNYRSTSVLEAIAFGVPTVLLDLPLMDPVAKLYHEAPISEADRALFFAKSEQDLKQMITSIIRDPAYRGQVLEANRRLYDYFVSPDAFLPSRV